MACNSCARPFSLLRPEKGCPCCGFSYCSKCLNIKIFVKKFNAERKVCGKCHRNDETGTVYVSQPRDYFYSCISKINESTNNSKGEDTGFKIEQEIQNRLQKLKESDNVHEKISNEDLAKRLQNLNGPIPSTSDAELYYRLAKVKGIPIDAVCSNKEIVPALNLKTEQEQADDLLKQYTEELKMESEYKDEFDNAISNLERRLCRLKGSNSNTRKIVQKNEENDNSEAKKKSLRKIIEKVKFETNLEEFLSDSHDELPFCEICNEDASVRCKGCKYLFCIRCFTEHKDDDDCNEYVIYHPP